jgi:hypothetical protein
MRGINSAPNVTQLNFDPSNFSKTRDLRTESREQVKEKGLLKYEFAVRAWVSGSCFMQVGRDATAIQHQLAMLPGAQNETYAQKLQNDSIGVAIAQQQIPEGVRVGVE